MPWLHEHQSEKRVEIDLHGYSLVSAEEVALVKVREAYDNGFPRITFIHGWSTARQVYELEPPGTIKHLLRSMLKRGEFEPYAYTWRNRGHLRSNASLTIALRSSPEPLEQPFWSALPPAEYDH
ncbi:Smr/MutS family protein [Chloroflexota bacterium]